MSVEAARSRNVVIRSILPVLGSLLALPLAAQQTGSITGYVVDAESGEPIAGVEVVIEDPVRTAVTDESGGFRLSDVPRGSRRLLLRHIAYGEHGRTLVLEGGGLLQYEIRMSREAIALTPLVVEVRSEREQARRASGNSIDLIERETIDLFERQGSSLVNLLGREVPGIRINSPCVEFRLQANSRGIGPVDTDTIFNPDPTISTTCRQPAVFLDGARVMMGLGEVPLDQIETVEVLSPSEASIRYGGQGAWGVILLESRTGFAPATATPRAHVTGLDWVDPVPYRWPRVLGVSLAANAASAALTFGVFLNCRGRDAGFGMEDALACSPPLAAGAGALTGVMGGILTGWAGQSTLTKGRLFPLMIVGSASATTGYLLLVRAYEDAREADRTVGIALSAVGTSVLMTLTDRVFRTLR